MKPLKGLIAYCGLLLLNVASATIGFIKSNTVTTFIGGALITYSIYGVIEYACKLYKERKQKDKEIDE